MYPDFGYIAIFGLFQTRILGIYIYIYIYIHIYIYMCEQNYPCSGYVDWLIVSKSCVLFPAFQLCMAEERALFFAWLGVLSQRGVGEQSLEIVRGY